MKPKVWIFAICFNEMPMIQWFLRHYSTFADRIIIWDEHSTDGTREAISACPIAQLINWPHKGLDDEEFIKTVNWHYRMARGQADWVMWPDIDELLYHPDPLGVLERADADVLPARGYTLISEKGYPTGDGQIYDMVKTGVRQENYDKWIIWRPGIEIKHRHGRHEVPVSSGKISHDFDFKLLHCHYVGGVKAGADRNRRNYDRALDKRFAWNYAPGEISRGTETWAEQMISSGKLIDVIAHQMPRRALVKLHLGCGQFKLPGWQNHDMDVDIRRRLPFEDGSASHIFIEHAVEHVTHQEAWEFFEECHRVLAMGGRLRVAIPDISRIAERVDPAYGKAVGGDGSRKTCIRAAICEHGHKGAWNALLLATMLDAIGFELRICEPGESTDPELCEIEQHGKTVGWEVARVETSVVEGIK